LSVSVADEPTDLGMVPPGRSVGIDPVAVKLAGDQRLTDRKDFQPIRPPLPKPLAGSAKPRREAVRSAMLPLPSERASSPGLADLPALAASPHPLA